MGFSFKEGNHFLIEPCASLTIYSLLGQFSGSSFLQPFDPSLCFTLDEGICLCGKGLCPGRGGERIVGVLLTTCQCTHSEISASRPEEPSPVGPREEAEDFRATDSGVMIKFQADSAVTNTSVEITE